MKKRDLFETVMHFEQKSSENFCYAHTVAGKTVISYSRTNPFAKIGTEARRVMGSAPRGPITAADIEAMRALAQRVRESYGELAVGALPSLPTKEEAA